MVYCFQEVYPSQYYLLTEKSPLLLQNEEKFNFEEKNPFIQEDEDGDVASVGYRYRKWDLDNGIELIARCEHDAVMNGPNGETQFINIKALNEWDSRVSTVTNVNNNYIHLHLTNHTIY